MDAEGKSLDYANFAEGMDELYKGMTVAEKKEILRFAKNMQKKSVQHNCLFPFKASRGIMNSLKYCPSQERWQGR